MKSGVRKKCGIAALLVFSVAAQAHAQDNGEESDRLDGNKRTVRTLFESVWNEERFDLIDQLWGPDVSFNFRGEAPVVSREGLQAQVSLWRGAFPDFHFVVEDLIAEGDLVAARVRFTGTHTGDDWFGLSATGKSIDVTEMMFFRFEQGLVVEVWEDYDEYVMRRQLGAE